MKTPDEIKKGLDTHANFGICMIDCPYDDPCRCGYSCSHELAKDGLAYIQQLEANYQQVSKALCGKENATLEEVLQAVRQVKTELEAVKRERDAAVKDMRFSAHCVNCKYRGKQENCDGTGCCYSCKLDCPCAKFPCGYEWRGVCPENTEVQDDY